MVKRDATPISEPANSQAEEAEEVVSRSSCRWWTEKVAPVVEGTQLQFRSKQSQSEKAEEVDTEGRGDQLGVFESGNLIFLSRGFRE